MIEKIYHFQKLRNIFPFAFISTSFYMSSTYRMRFKCKTWKIRILFMVFVIVSVWYWHAFLEGVRHLFITSLAKAIHIYFNGTKAWCPIPFTMYMFPCLSYTVAWGSPTLHAIHTHSAHERHGNMYIVNGKEYDAFIQLKVYIIACHRQYMHG